GSLASPVGETPWASDTGGVAGTLYCSPEGDRSAIYWTDTQRLTGYYATAEYGGVTPLLTWWQQHVRGSATGASSGFAAIHSAFAGAVQGRLARCSPEPDP